MAGMAADIYITKLRDTRFDYSQEAAKINQKWSHYTNDQISSTFDDSFIKDLLSKSSTI